MSTKSKTPSYKFYVEIRETYKFEKSSPHFKHYPYYVGVSVNGKDLFVSETYKRKSSLIKTINNLFPNVVIKDKTV